MAKAKTPIDSVWHELYTRQNKGSDPKEIWSDAKSFHHAALFLRDVFAGDIEGYSHTFDAKASEIVVKRVTEDKTETVCKFAIDPKKSMKYDFDTETFSKA